jgi:tetratricopeptide (TPR) repeat protein
MFNVWLFLIISISFLIIIFIIFRHFPALAVLDVNNIPEEKEGKIKEKIIRERMKRKLSFFDKFFNNILSFFNNISSSFWLFLGKLKKQEKDKQDEKILAQVGPEEKINILLNQAKDLMKKEEWVEAEKKLIEIISMDDKNFSAFWELGEVYRLQEKWQEAKQTLLYTLKLAKIQEDNISSSDVSSLNYYLALINKELNDIEGAFLNMSQALELELNNPRYLDLMLDLCIMKKDKKLSLEYLERIKEVNPENNNIPDWQRDVNDISREDSVL